MEIQEDFEKNPDLIPKEEKQWLSMNDNQLMDSIKKMTIEIETIIFCKHNKNTSYKILPEYINRIRAILANLKDENNSELRRKILTGQMTAHILSEIDEKVYF